MFLGKILCSCPLAVPLCTLVYKSMGPGEFNAGEGGGGGLTLPWNCILSKGGGGELVILLVA